VDAVPNLETSVLNRYRHAMVRPSSTKRQNVTARFQYTETLEGNFGEPNLETNAGAIANAITDTATGEGVSTSPVLETTNVGWVVNNVTYTLPRSIPFLPHKF
jgi:hypothetical protein